MQKPKLVVRKAEMTDIPGVRSLSARAYPDITPYSEEMIAGQINNYPEGQFVAEHDGKIVGFCATFRISGEVALKTHTWKEITGGGFASRHDRQGEYLYGMEVCVDPDKRGLRIGQRLYSERKRLCRYYHLKGIIFGGRIPGFARRKKKYPTPSDYVEAVKRKEIRDQVLSFQIRNGFEVLGILPGYLRDPDSHDHAVHLIWRNPELPSTSTSTSVPSSPETPISQYRETVRVASVQYAQRRIDSFETFMRHVEYFVDVVADRRADFVLFPEHFTLQLLSIENKPLPPLEAIASLNQYIGRFKKEMSEIAVRYNINVIGGSTPLVDAEGIHRNVAFAFLRDGSIHEQSKIHPTPDERRWWNIEGGNRVQVIPTDCGPIGILVCYDSEFPELARHLTDQGTQILFVPFCTDDRQGHLRVRYCSQARAIENQIYVVTSGNVGNLPGVENMDVQYAQSAILTPSDYPFARDGIAADSTPNTESVIMADVNLKRLHAARNDGTVRNLKDRRHDLYRVTWNNRKGR